MSRPASGWGRWGRRAGGSCGGRRPSIAPCIVSPHVLDPEAAAVPLKTLAGLCYVVRGKNPLQSVDNWSAFVLGPDATEGTLCPRCPCPFSAPALDVITSSGSLKENWFLA